MIQALCAHLYWDRQNEKWVQANIGTYLLLRFSLVSQRGVTLVAGLWAAWLEVDIEVSPPPARELNREM